MIPTQGGQGPRRVKQAVSEPLPTRAVPKPVAQSQVKDPRTYQLQQLRRRYSPKETTLKNGDTSLRFKLPPSDPDFPFELEFLDCDLHVPAQFPKEAPRLVVKNQDIPRGFAINIERGWDNLVAERPGAKLLALANALDKALESLLSEQKAETVKLTIFKDTRHLDGEPAASKDALVAAPPQPAPTPTPTPRRYIREPFFTPEQIAEAKSRRAQEVRQLEARMGREPIFHKSSDGVVYTLPIDVRRRADLPAGLQSVRSVQLIIPLLYPLQALRVLLNDVESPDAEGVEELFVEKAAEQKQMTLTSHLNYLAANMHLLAKQASSRMKKDETQGGAAPTDASADAQAKEAEHNAIVDAAKGHIHVIPRPPEWSRGSDSSESESDSSDEPSNEEDEDEDGGGAAVDHAEANASTAAHQTPERGIAVTFPSLEMHGIELLQITSLSLAVKCERCKTINEVSNLKDNAEKQTSCKKCASAFAVRFRPEYLHQHSARAGFLDVSGCTVADLLPSTFTPTCARCSTEAAAAASGLVAVRGDKITNVCRACHGRFSISLGPEVKFLPYAPNALRTSAAPAARPKTDDRLGLVHAGAPLPGRGACAHYRRSFRWFRFGCCGRVHACDRCHDAAEDHANEFAPRMLCGWCSREQRYDPESCRFCGRSVVGGRGTGFWEGGKGTRDKTLMRRGDRRKYKRVGGGERKKKKKAKE